MHEEQGNNNSGNLIFVNILLVVVAVRCWYIISVGDSDGNETCQETTSDR